MKESFIRHKRLIVYGTIFLCVVLFFISDSLFRYYGLHSYLNYRFPLFVILTSFWMIHMDRIILDKGARRLLFLTGILILFGSIVQNIKFNLYEENTFIARFLWYSYYVPLTLIPLFLFLATLHFRKGDGKPLRWEWYLLFVPAFLLIVLFLTNDFHELAFRFLSENKTEDYTHGIVYYLDLGWNVVLLGAVLFLSFQRAVHHSYRKFGFLPLVPLVLGGIFISLRQNHIPVIISLSFSEYYWIMIMLFYETLCNVKMIPTNMGYKDFFRESSLNMIICNKGLTPVYKSGKDEYSYGAETMKQAIQNPVLISENVQLNASPVPGGFVFYTNDLSSIRNAQKKQDEINGILSEYRELLESENELAKTEASIRARSEIYDKIFHTIQPEYDYIQNKLSGLSSDSPDFIITLRKLSIVDSYIKRISNLLLLQENKKELSITDLTYSLTETKEYLKIAGIDIDFSVKSCPDCILSRTLIQIYQLIWKIIFNSLETIESVGVYLTCLENKKLNLRIFVEGEEKEYVGEGLISDYSIRHEKDNGVTVYFIEFGGMNHD